MDLQHFEGAVCPASFGQLWSGSPRQVTESSNIAVRLQAYYRSPQENFFGGTFRSISAVDLLIYDFSAVHMVLTIYTLNCATVRIHRMTKYLAINPSDDNT